MRIAIDTGGTFTDCVALIDGRLQVLKLRSIPHDPGAAVLAGVSQLCVDRPAELSHGTTVGTNAMLERKGARVAFVTTQGFEDVIAIGRQTRPRLYALEQPAPPCLVPAELRFGIPERVTAEGTVLRAPTEAELTTLVENIRASGAGSIALSLLFSFLNPANELLVEQALAPLGLPLSTAHRILPEFREYERASTLAVNAYLAPLMQSYLLGLEAAVSQRAHAGSVQVMQSSGGIVSAVIAAAEPVRTVLSGPAGGVMGAWLSAQAAVPYNSGLERIIGFDMGGTSTDVFLADATLGGPALSAEGSIAGLPLTVPMLDIHTAGAGGGSLARFDAGGLLRVGPESAGADPGPICFGGTQPTVTDANLLLGRLDGSRFIDGSVQLDTDRTRAAFDLHKGPLPSVEAFAAGILRVVEAHMARAIRVISIERGHDPRRCTLVAFGGGGPLHACAVARALGVPQVMIPSNPGALSAVGILLSDAVRDHSRTVMLPGTRLTSLDAEFQALASLHPLLSSTPCLTERSVDLRYRGQGYELNIPYTPNAAADFHTLHAQRYGFSDPTRPLEIVNLRIRQRIAAPPYSPTPEPLISGDGSHALRTHQRLFFDAAWHDAPLYDRDLLRPGDTFPGPALIAEYTSATVLPPGAKLRVDALRNLILDVGT